MLRRALIAGIGVAVVASVAVAAQPPQSERPVAAPGAAPVTAQLKLNQDVEVDARGTRVKLRLVDLKDSRCPSDVACVWAGEAIASITVTPLAPGQPAGSATVKMPGDAQTAGGVVLRLQSVEPYPKTSQPTSPAQVVVTVSVAKA